jgi:hypothetical protein
MDTVKMALVAMAVLPLGLGSIHVTEKLRWRESRRGLRLAAAAALVAFCAGCALLALHHDKPFSAGGYSRTLLEMAFLTYFLVAAAYLLHCTEWVMTRLGRKVFMDELFSRMLALGIFAAAALACYLALALLFGA